MTGTTFISPRTFCTPKLRYQGKEAAEKKLNKDNKH
jgi:hypothetical protein